MRWFEHCASISKLASWLYSTVCTYSSAPFVIWEQRKGQGQKMKTKPQIEVLRTPYIGHDYLNETTSLPVSWSVRTDEGEDLMSDNKIRGKISFD